MQLLQDDWFGELVTAGKEAYVAKQSTKMKEAPAQQAAVVRAVPVDQNPQPVYAASAMAQNSGGGVILPKHSGLAFGAVGVLVVALVVLRVAK